MRQKSPITMATMEYLQWINTARIATTKGKLRVSGVDAQHQNAQSEHAIQTIMYLARTVMVHTYLLNCTERGADALSLWSFAVTHSVWMYNWIPNKESGLTTL